jgi:chemotaxis protein CheX
MSDAKKKEIDFGRDPFELVRTDAYFLVRLFGNLEGDVGKEFERRISTFLGGAELDIVVDAELLTSLQPSWVRPLMGLVTYAKGKKKQVRIFGATEKIRQFFSEQGVSSSMVCVPSLPIALKSMGIHTAKKLDVNFINPFLTSAAEVISSQTQSVVRPGAPYLKDSKESFGGDISGVIGLVSDHFNGTVVISFPEATYCKIMSKMLGEEFTELTPDIHDGAAEFTNMIFGRAKVILNEKGYGIKMAIPTVISGKNHSIQSKSTGPRVAIPYDSDFGKFAVEISISD